MSATNTSVADLYEQTIVDPPRPPPRFFEPTSCTLRMPNAPPLPVRPPSSGVRLISPSVPALANDVEPEEADDALRARFRKGRRPWALLGGAALVAAVVGTIAMTGHGSSRSASAFAAAPRETTDVVLERERTLRASRAAGQWVEIPEEMQHIPSSTSAPCESKALPAGSRIGSPCPEPSAGSTPLSAK
jgi:hypothetical protein